MAKDTPFKAYDLRRRNLHKIPSSPMKISQHRVDKRLWAEVTKRAVKQGTRKCRRRTVAKKAKQGVAATAANILREDSFETECLNCGRSGADPKCNGAKCYSEFAKNNFPGDFVDIKGPGPFGYAAYTKPGVTIKKDQWLGEYIGELLPYEAYKHKDSLYKFVLTNTCVLDSEKYGNWTRFINSNCNPNVICQPFFVGKRKALLFYAKKEIEPEEELTFYYGKPYFTAAGIPCKCSTCEKGIERQKIHKIIELL